MQGRAVASDLKISPIIDHPALRSFINSIAKLKGESACLSIITIEKKLGLQKLFIKRFR